MVVELLVQIPSRLLLVLSFDHVLGWGRKRRGKEIERGWGREGEKIEREERKRSGGERKGRGGRGTGR